LQKGTEDSATVFCVYSWHRLAAHLYELETQIQLCHDLDFIQPAAAKDLVERCNEVARMINGLLKSLKSKDIKQAAN
jgi:hypothetical protein